MGFREKLRTFQEKVGIYQEAFLDIWTIYYDGVEDLLNLEFEKLGEFPSELPRGSTPKRAIETLSPIIIGLFLVHWRGIEAVLEAPVRWTLFLGGCIIAAILIFFTSRPAALYWAKLENVMKRLDDPSLDRKSRQRILFSISPNRKKRYFYSEIWFDIIAVASKGADMPAQYRGRYPWFREFDLIADTDRASVDETFIRSREEFQHEPEAFVRVLNKFSKDLLSRDILRKLLQEIGQSSQELAETWLYLHSRISSLTVGGHAGSPAVTSPESSYLTAALDTINQATKTQPDEYSGIAEALQGFICASISESLSTHKQAASWEKQFRDHRLFLLEDVFVQNPNQKMLHRISDWLREWTMNPRTLSEEQDEFQSRVSQFLEHLSGESESDFKKATSRLWDIGTENKQQWDILYKVIEKQQTEIYQQGQLISCLEYRHALEMLPNRSAAMLQGLPGKAPSATLVWKKTWEGAVKLELQHMIHERIFNNAAASPAGGPPVPPVPSQRTGLQDCLRSDFDFWANRKLNTVTQLPTTPNPLVDYYKLPYDEWSIYLRGLSMYNELSKTIHGYGREYKVNESNWAESDRVIFDWLSPSVVDGEVDWGQEWTNRGLPI